MSPEDAIRVADNALVLSRQGNPLTDIQRFILRESLAGKRYEDMEGYAVQHIKNEGAKLWKLLSAGLGERVSRTNFKGALEKRLRASSLALKPPQVFSYKQSTWVGRDVTANKLSSEWQKQPRLLWITGISGIGKTTLGEYLVSRAWERNPSFQWIYLEILEGESTDFAKHAADLLTSMGDQSLDLQQRNNPNHLIDRLLRRLQAHRYWLQLDTLEHLLNPEQPTEFVDAHWMIFFRRCLIEPDFSSRLVLTTQAIPDALIEFGDRYPNVCQGITLRGLVADEQHNEHLELFHKLFHKNDIAVEESNQPILRRIGQIYEGHPLVLGMIANDILKDFAGNVAAYWQKYGNEFEQAARELQLEQGNPALYGQALRKHVCRRVEKSLKRLPKDALDLLCRSSVYRRPVPEIFWLTMIADRSSTQQAEAYSVLHTHTLINQEDIYQDQGQLCIRQTNLIREVAYNLLKVELSTWQTAELTAARMWQLGYKPMPNALKLEKVRGYLEAFHHYCNIEAWSVAAQILSKQLDNSEEHTLSWQLGIWGYYREIVDLHNRLIGKLDNITEFTCLNTLGIAYCSLGDFSQAIKYIQKALTKICMIDNCKLKGVCYMIDSCRSEDNHCKSRGDILGNLGLAYHSSGDYKKAKRCYQQAVESLSEIGKPQVRGSILGNLGNLCNSLGNYAQAIEYHQKNLTIARATNDCKSKGNALTGLGVAYRSLGEYLKAIECHQQHLIIAHKNGDCAGKGAALENLGIAYYFRGKYFQAIRCYQQSLFIARKVGNRQGEGNSLTNLAEVYIELDKHSKALKSLDDALTIFKEIKYQPSEAEARRLLAELYRKLGHFKKAYKLSSQALKIAAALEIPLAEKCQKLKENLAKLIENK